MSLFEGERNAFYEPGADMQLSKVARSFMAGLLRHAPEITAVTNQWVNSYKRLVAGDEAHRSSAGVTTIGPRLFESPCTNRTKGNSARIEYRALDSACNPTWHSRCCLLPGSRDRRRTGLTAGDRDDVWRCRPQNVARWAFSRCPRVSIAIQAMERSELVAETLGEHVFDFFLRNKRAEWDEYARQVTVQAHQVPPGSGRLTR